VEKVRALEEELAILRREQSEPLPCMLEALRFNAGFCAPRQFNPRIRRFPVNISGSPSLPVDFFKVFEIDSALGIVVWGYRCKGLAQESAATHLVSLIYRCALSYADPWEAVASSQSRALAVYGDRNTSALFARIDLRNGEIVYSMQGCPSPVFMDAR